jgi:biotin carboxyl carrier protein
MAAGMARPPVPPVRSRPVIEVRAEMAANVWQVLVETGQSVAAGAELVILESMKMEIPVEAPVAATVAAVRVAPEASVQEGDVLVVLDPA